MSEVHTYEPCPECGAIRGTVQIGGEVKVSIPQQCKDFEGCRDGRPLVEDEFARDFGLAPGRGQPPALTVQRCIAVGCDEEIPLNRDWCSRHYALIPEKLKPAIWHAKTEAEKVRALNEAKVAVEKREFGERLL